MDNSWSSNGNSESEAKSEVDQKENNEENLKNISPYMSKDLVAAAGFNVETPIVNAIIGNLTGSLPTKKSETEMIKCEICDCELSSNIVLSFHINGSKHKKRLKALEIIAQLKDAKDKGVQLGDNDNPNAFRCEICSLTVNSAQQLEIHLSGSKHKKKAAKAGVSEPAAQEQTKNSEGNENTDNTITPPAAKKKKKDEQVLIPCKICNIFMNSQTQYDQHLVSRKHLNRATGKQQQQRRMQGRGGKFMKFPPSRGGGGPRFQKPPPNHAFQNEPPHQFNNSIYNKLFPYSNFLTKNPFFSNYKNGDNKMNSFRQPNPFQKRF